LAQPLSAYVVDTSVVVNWYVETGEPDVAQALRLLEHFGSGLCVLRAPDLLLFELANALVASHRLRMPAVLQALSHLRELNIELHSFRWSTLVRAVEIASASGTTIYDSYFLALALETNSTLITADQAFLRKTQPYARIVPLRRLGLSGRIS
jgi:predicted nucleic acid-binding protein